MGHKHGGDVGHSAHEFAKKHGAHAHEHNSHHKPYKHGGHVEGHASHFAKKHGGEVHSENRHGRQGYKGNGVH